MNPRKFKSGTVFYKAIYQTGTTIRSGSVVVFEMPQPITVAILGDSFAAGEGAPHDPHEQGDKWLSNRCHRSNNSAKALALAELKENVRVAVESINVSCSGAGVTEGLVKSQLLKGWGESAAQADPVKPQVQRVGEWLKENDYERINVAMISIGINEIFFADIVSRYFISPVVPLGMLDQDQKAQDGMLHAIENLRIDYATLKHTIDDNFAVDRVLVSQYPDISRWKNGEFCGIPLHDYGFCWNGLERTSGAPEYRIIDQMGQKMNATVGEAIQQFAGWQQVTGIYAKTRGHGLCRCDEPYFNTIGDSILVQQDPFGTWHPNRSGHRAISGIEKSFLSVAVSKVQTAFLKDHGDEVRTGAAIRRAIENSKKFKAKEAAPDLPSVTVVTP